MKLFLRITLFVLLMPAAAWAQPRLPNPQMVLTSTEIYTVNGQTFRRYRFDVTNKAAYPAAFFAPAPALPPCGSNHNSSRTWVDFFDGGNHRIYGFCALGAPANLADIWFALPYDQMPPASVAIVMTDRQANLTYRSNPVSLTADALMARAEALPRANWRAAFGLAELALQIRFPGNAAIDRVWFNRFRRFGVQGALF